MAEEEEVEIVVDINNDLERRIADVFELFDHTGTKKVDIRDIATILRGLGCCPTEAEIQEVMVEIEDPKNPDVVHLQTFLPYAARLITEHKYEPATPDKLLEAFHVLDPEGHGYLTKDFFMTVMSQDGEPFNEDEIAEMMEIAVDPYTQRIPYEYYINQLMHNPEGEAYVYRLADRVEDEREKTPPQQTFSQILAAMANTADV